MMHATDEQPKALKNRGGETGEGHARGTASSALLQAKDAVADAGEGLRDRVERASSQAVDVAEDVYASSRRAAQSMSLQVEGHPLSALLLAAMIGYFAGYLIHGRR